MPRSPSLRKVIISFALFVLGMVGILVYFSLQPRPGILLGTLDGKGSRPSGINRSGQITGEFHGEVGIARPFIWTKEQGMKGLGISGVSWGINDQGHVVGIAGTDVRDEYVFLWTPSAGVSKICDLAFPFGASVRWGEQAGMVLISYRDEDENYSYFIWTEDAGKRAVTAREFRDYRPYAHVDGPRTVRIEEDGSSFAYVITARDEKIKLPLMGGVASAAFDGNGSGQIIGVISFAPPWWVRACEWLCEKLNIPRQYRINTAKYFRDEAVLWTVPMREDN
ncbi:MAG: hypothetical protein LBV12_02895 [Puniceicoccales bacterium]|jgi:uncharacterized membrane protein|nr:hypothetical protein [Puniceicoccales bacterium]